MCKNIYIYIYIYIYTYINCWCKLKAWNSKKQQIPWKVFRNIFNSLMPKMPK